MKKEKVTIKDIAKYADVSIATVSRYINKTRRLNEETAGRIQAAIEHFNYIPNDNARALRSRNERIIGIIFSDISNSFFAKIFKIAEEILFEKRIFVLLCNSNENGDKEREYLYRLLQKRVDAIIIAPTGQNQDLLKSISKTTPVIIFDRNQEDISADQLYANDYSSSHQLASYIVEHGHRQIAYAMGVPNSSAAKHRYEGFLEAMKENRIPPSSYRILYSQDEVTCRKEFHELLLQDQITAVIITSPKKLDWFLMERNQLYLRGFQSSLSFAGYATQNEFDISEIPLTGLLQKEEVYATKLAKMILDRLEKPNGKIKNVELKLTFRKGNSVANCKKTEPPA
ncbi:MAG: LacI family DNA-binding transcriptional regulator [Clostridiaceae bacterium]|nr:LacI family DNA-binding transcriptional regulator [Clostridiaceae bacterium]